MKLGSKATRMSAGTDTNLEDAEVIKSLFS
jgi:hypothetical protein